MWEAAVDIVVGGGELRYERAAEALQKGTYGDVKGDALFVGREVVKQDVRRVALNGWKKNVGDDEWRLDQRLS